MMKAKWLFLIVLFIVILMAAGVWIRQDKSSTIANLSPSNNEIQPPIVLAASGEVVAAPLANKPDKVKMTQPESVRRKAGEPLNSPPIPVQFPAPPAPQMGWAEARYEIDGRVIAPGNQHGQMALVHVVPGALISATLKWPKAIPGATVALEVVDGGRLEDGQLSQLVRVDEQGEIQLRYVANRQPGKCQVVARCGMDETVLCFWVADESAKNIPAGL